MEFKGTKGEWNWNKPEDSNGYVYVDGDDTFGGGVATCYNEGTAIANAKLIAASKDLLEALQELVEVDLLDPYELHKSQQKAITAINKALK